MNKRNILACAVSAAFLAKAGEEAGAAGNVVADEDSMQRWAVKGSTVAKEMIEGEVKQSQAFVNLLTMVAKIPDHDDAVAFSDGYKDTCTKAEKVGTKEHRAAAKRAMSYAARFNKVIRAVHGTNVGSKKFKPGIGLKETLSIMEAKTGTVWDKLKQLPSSGEGRKPKSAEVAMQSRVTKNADEVVVPGFDTLSKALSIKPTKTDNAKSVERAASIGVVQVIKAVPESMLNDMLQACLDRLAQSPDKFYSELSKNFADHWTKAASVEAIGQHHGKATKPAKVEAGAEAAAK